MRRAAHGQLCDADSDAAGVLVMSAWSGRTTHTPITYFTIITPIAVSI